MRAVFVYLLNSKFTDMSDSSQKAIKYKYNEELAYLLAQRP